MKSFCRLFRWTSVFALFIGMPVAQAQHGTIVYDGTAGAGVHLASDDVYPDVAVRT